MYKKTLGVCMAFIFAVSLYSNGTTPVAQAALISDEEIHEQRLEVMEKLVLTLQEQVKLIQMNLILKLEHQVSVLEARVDAQSK